MGVDALCVIILIRKFSSGQVKVMHTSWSASGVHSSEFSCPNYASDREILPEGH